MTTPVPHILLVGCGKMGAALAGAWLRVGYSHLTIVEPHDLPPEIDQGDVQHFTHLDDIAHHQVPFDVVVLAVKPQMMNDVILHLHPILRETTLVISIAAGFTVTGLCAGLRNHPLIVRAMPNLPASIGRGITALYTSTPLQAGDLTLTQNLMAAVGHTIWVEDEDQMDAITALSGSGPAYVFLLTEVMAAAGEKLGLPPQMSMHLARQTVIGSAGLLQAAPEISAATLRENVTSPGGTTAAALDVLMKNNALAELFTHALGAACARSKELKH